jgi:hypothetical protein
MNYNQYLEDYWPEEKPNDGTTEQVHTIYYYDYGQVSCIDRQIAELEARKDALLNGYCFTGYYDTKPYLDPYGLDE